MDLGNLVDQDTVALKQKQLQEKDNKLIEGWFLYETLSKSGDYNMVTDAKYIKKNYPELNKTYEEYVRRGSIIKLKVQKKYSDAEILEKLEHTKKILGLS